MSSLLAAMLAALTWPALGQPQIPETTPETSPRVARAFEEIVSLYQMLAAEWPVGAIDDLRAQTDPHTRQWHAQVHMLCLYRAVNGWRAKNTLEEAGDWRRLLCDLARMADAIADAFSDCIAESAPSDAQITGMAALRAAAAGLWQQAVDARPALHAPDPSAQKLCALSLSTNLGDAVRVLIEDWGAPPPALDGYLLPYLMNRVDALAGVQVCPATGQRYLLATDARSGLPMLVCPYHGTEVLVVGADRVVSRYVREQAGE